MLAIINILIVITLGVIIYLVWSLIKFKSIKQKLTKTKTYSKLSEQIFLGVKRKLLPSRFGKANPFIVFGIMMIIFIVSFLIFYSYIKVWSTSFILSLPFFLSPIIILKILLNREKSQIIKALPMYVVNIKNHVSEDNNIITAIQRTSVEEPLKKYIQVFKVNVARGLNVIEAFELLKKDVNIESFTTFINSCEACYLNGGNFSSILERYIDIITKENVHKENTREKAHADIITLLIMIILNILVIVMFVFTNKEYAKIIRETLLGKLILNFNATSYLLIAYLISKIYKEE